ncbi:hypothetical protein GJ744_010876 [Endocarpon pusillum]|uniref:Uncharacterized protein n=1 Tax=Endocarpon pusillum TaxID=364733 RepID=A0A8H7AFM4_9EURO|nr:hypothetical protein GJ744_010876 [Endocarpon pusillum]
MSLRSTVLICSLFYQAFISAEVLITTRVLKNQVDLEVLPEAIAVVASSYLQPWPRERIQEFVHDHLDSRKSQLPSWTLAQALLLDNLHRHVQSFAAAFASEALTKQLGVDELDAIPKYPPSPDEIHRVQRALYRFELYCNLFRDSRTLFNIKVPMGLFFNKFSPWENEQLGSIHDYLFHIFSPAFTNMTEEDVAWGAFEVDITDELDSGYIQHLMSLGLSYIHELRQQRPTKTATASYMICTQNSTMIFYIRFAHRYAPFFHEQDPGPERAWRWALQDATRANFIYTDSEQLLRKRGYCFGDLTRLEAWPQSHQLWEPPTLSPSASDL